jgi:hypothetical protein
MPTFLFIQLCQVLFLSGSMVLTASFIADGSQGLNIAHAFHKNLNAKEAIPVEIALFFTTCLLLRLFLNFKRTLLLLTTLILYTACGAFMVCHICSLVICDDEEECPVDSPIISRGRNAVYLGAILLILPLFVVYYINFIHNDILLDDHHEWSTMVEKISLVAIISNTIVVVFVACCTVCIIDDTVWDWRYGYALLFTLAITTYISGVSSYILFEEKTVGFSLEKTTRNALQTQVLIILQPLLFVEASIKLCMIT